MDKAEVTRKLKDLIETETKISIESDDQELDIDSFVMMMTITFIEAEFGVALDMDELDFDAFKSLNTLADLTLNKGGVAAA